MVQISRSPRATREVATHHHNRSSPPHSLASINLHTSSKMFTKTFLSAIMLLVASATANPIIKRQDSDVTCGDTVYYPASLQDAVNAGYNYLQEGEPHNFSSPPPLILTPNTIPREQISDDQLTNDRHHSGQRQIPSPVQQLRRFRLLHRRTLLRVPYREGLCLQQWFSRSRQGHFQRRWHICWFHHSYWC